MFYHKRGVRVRKGSKSARKTRPLPIIFGAARQRRCAFDILVFMYNSEVDVRK